MNREQIIKMARDAGFNHPALEADADYYKLERFASAIRAATKEEDAKICERLQDGEYPNNFTKFSFAGVAAAKAIRASK